MTYVKDLMESGMANISGDASLSDAAQLMKQNNCGFLPVGSETDPMGVITDRDIVLRALSEGKDPSKEKVRDYMTGNICTVPDSSRLEEAANIMRENHVSRLIVTDENGTPCGVLSFGRILRSDEDRTEAGSVVEIATGKAA